MREAASRQRRRSPNAPFVRWSPYRSFARTATESAASVRVESCGPSAADFVEQPGARQPDVAMHGCGRRADRSGDLVVRQAAEIVQLNDLGQPRFQLPQALQGIIKPAAFEAQPRP